MKRLISCLLILTAFLGIPSSAFCRYDKTFRTKYTTIHYADDKDFSDFIWRIGGEKFDASGSEALASSRIDRIVERVEAILDMQPRRFHVDVYLHRGEPEKNRVAFYERRGGGIYISVDNASDGVFAHEIAHAVINRYFKTPPSSKIQEILTQYVDRYLWSDY